VCIITDGQARRIASEWHGGQVSALYSLASCGYVDGERLLAEIAREVQALDVGVERRDLLALDKYVRARIAAGDMARRPHGPAEWDHSPVTVNHC